VPDTTKSNVGILESPVIEPASASGERKGKRGRKPASEKANGVTKARYFLLAKSSGQESGKLVLGEEFESEDKALVRSLVDGIPFLRVETYIASTQKKGTSIVIEKRPHA
jgi:hypothetical protein